MTLSINDQPIVSARISMPRACIWLAHIETSVASKKQTGAVTIKGFGLSLSGTVVFESVYAGVVRQTITPGAGKWGETAKPQSYQNALVRVVLDDLAREAGVTVSTKTDTALLSRKLPHFVRPPMGTLGTALDVLTGTLGCVWRCEDNGSILIVADTYPTQTLDHRVVDGGTEYFSQTISPQSFALRPGVTFNSQRVERVEHIARDRYVRTKVFFEWPAAA